MSEEQRYHRLCGSPVTLDDPEEPCWWCSKCQDTVHTNMTMGPRKDVSNA